MWTDTKTLGREAKTSSIDFIPKGTSSVDADVRTLVQLPFFRGKLFDCVFFQKEEALMSFPAALTRKQRF
jgi:hypothetical protein